MRRRTAESRTNLPRGRNTGSLSRYELARCQVADRSRTRHARQRPTQLMTPVLLVNRPVVFFFSGMSQRSSCFSTTCAAISTPSRVEPLSGSKPGHRKSVDALRFADHCNFCRIVGRLYRIGSRVRSPQLRPVTHGKYFEVCSGACRFRRCGGRGRSSPRRPDGVPSHRPSVEAAGDSEGAVPRRDRRSVPLQHSASGRGGRDHRSVPEREHQYATPYFAYAAGTLIHAGRARDLLAVRGEGDGPRHQMLRRRQQRHPGSTREFLHRRR